MQFGVFGLSADLMTAIRELLILPFVLPGRKCRSTSLKEQQIEGVTGMVFTPKKLQCRGNRENYVMNSCIILNHLIL